MSNVTNKQKSEKLRRQLAKSLVELAKLEGRNPVFEIRRDDLPKLELRHKRENVSRQYHGRIASLKLKVELLNRKLKALEAKPV